MRKVLIMQTNPMYLDHYAALQS